MIITFKSPKEEKDLNFDVNGNNIDYYINNFNYYDYVSEAMILMMLECVNVKKRESNNYIYRFNYIVAKIEKVRNTINNSIQEFKFNNDFNDKQLNLISETEDINIEYNNFMEDKYE